MNWSVATVRIINTPPPPFTYFERLPSARLPMNVYLSHNSYNKLETYFHPWTIHKTLILVFNWFLAICWKCLKQFQALELCEIRYTKPKCVKSLIKVKQWSSCRALTFTGPLISKWKSCNWFWALAALLKGFLVALLAN